MPRLKRTSRADPSTSESLQHGCTCSYCAGDHTGGPVIDLRDVGKRSTFAPAERVRLALAQSRQTQVRAELDLVERYSDALAGLAHSLAGYASATDSRHIAKAAAHTCHAIAELHDRAEQLAQAVAL